MTIDLPCDTWVDMDVSAATILNDSGGDPTGQYSDGVIWGAGANFWFDIEFDPTKAYTFEVTFDSTSIHDGGNREVDLWGVRPGSEQSDFDAFTVAGFHSSGHPVSTDVGDVITFTVGPDLARVDNGGLFSGIPDWNDGSGGVAAGWSRPFIETTSDSAVIAVRVMKVCIPCDTWVDLDLSTATQMGDIGGPFGQYADGVIYTVSGNFPDFWFPFAVDPVKRYRVEVTYDPDSAHDGGGREVFVGALRPGHETDDHDHALDVGQYAGGVAALYDTGANPGDVQKFTLGRGMPRGDEDFITPDLPGWDDVTLGVSAGYTRLWFESDHLGAVSAIRIRKVCKPAAPLRQYPRPTLRVYPAPQTIQSGLRRGPSAII